MCGRLKSPIIDAARNPCAAGVFETHTFNDWSAKDVIATDQWCLKERVADSESRFLAIKKFLCQPASRLIGARQNRFFARIARI
jgi:hypothetical protein